MSSLVSTVDPKAYYVPPAPKAPAGLNMATFLHLLTVQMANQNPLEPMKDSDLFGQISQLGQVQGMTNLQTQGNFNKAQSMIGKMVDAVNPAATSAGDAVLSGLVSGVTVATDGTVKLNLTESNGSTTTIDPGSVQKVYDMANSDPSAIPANYTYLIGKQVSGMNGTTSVSGQASGIGVSNGVIMVDVLTSAGVKLQMPVGSITSIT